MIDITDKKQCCGCSACVQACPKDCIEMIEDEEGFLYPLVDKEKCTDCNICSKICPMENIARNKDREINAYAAYSNNLEVRMESSSGAIFSLYADAIIKKDGVVFGASFDEDNMVHHIFVENKDQMHKLRGSKYTQSRIENTYIEVQKFLQEKRYVLFSGTACQVAGLKNFLRKQYDNLYTIDVLCHGVPSPKVWRKYIDELENKYDSKVSSVNFRNKETGWKTYSIDIRFNNHQKYRKRYDMDSYMNLFLSDICLRPSCHNCKYKSLSRASDITLGDSWGIDKYMLDMDDDKGTSVVITHTLKGQELFDSYKDHMKFKQAEVEKILPASSDSRNSVKMHRNRSKFFKLLNKGVNIIKLEKLVKINIFITMKIKIKRIIKKKFYFLV